MQNQSARHLLFLCRRMVRPVFALLDVRRVILLVVLAGGVSTIHAWGPPELQAPINRFIVTPLVKSGTGLWYRGVAVLHEIGRRLGWAHTE